MNEVDALAQIRGLARAGRVRFTWHAVDEAKQAGASELDVMNALCKAASCRHQPSNDRWKVKGPDLMDDELVVIVVIQDELVVVTVW